MGKTRTVFKRIFVTSSVGTLAVLGLGILNIALSNGEVNKQRLGIFLVFRVFFVLCAFDVLAFLGLLVMDIKTRKASIWMYLLLVVLVASFLMLPVILVGKTWNF